MRFSLHLLIAAIVLNLPVALGLVVLYRRAVLRAMSRSTGGADPVASRPESVDTTAPPPLVITTADATTPLAPTRAAAAWVAATQAALRRTTLAYGAGAVALAVVITGAWHAALTHGGQFLWLWAVWWAVSLGWPIPIGIGLIAATDRRQWTAIVAAYLGIVVLLSIACLAIYPGLHVGHLAANFAASLMSAVPAVALLQRRIRAVGLLTFVFTLAMLVAGAELLVPVFRVSKFLLESSSATATALARPDDVSAISFALVAVWWAVLHVLQALGPLGMGAIIAGAATGAGAVLAWTLLRGIGAAYRRKRLSDESLALDGLALAVTAGHSVVLLVLADWPGAAAAGAAFAAYAVVSRTVRAVLAARDPAPAEGPVLVLLRVFALGRRSERLFDALSKRWLRTGAIALIAGPDLATRIVQPHQIVEFLARRLTRNFIAGASDLRRRLREMDTRPDPDGRYRVNQFFCHADTWQATMRGLASMRAVVLMDLRSFSPSNQGCVYELGSLLDLVPLDRTLFIVDRTTDEAFLESTLRRLWPRTAEDSPNRKAVRAEVQVFRAGDAMSRDVAAIAPRLLSGASARSQAEHAASVLSS